MPENTFLVLTWLALCAIAGLIVRHGRGWGALFVLWYQWRKDRPHPKDYWAYGGEGLPPLSGWNKRQFNHDLRQWRINRPWRLRA